MESITLFYTRISEKRQRRANRLQSASAAFGLLAGLMDGPEAFQTTGFIIPILFGLLILVNLSVAILYDRLKSILSHRFEALLFRINGMAMLVTGILFHLTGKDQIQYAYYFLSIAYFLLLPWLFARLQKRRKVSFDKSGVTISRITRKLDFRPWSAMTEIRWSGNTIHLAIKGRRDKKFHLIQNQNVGLQEAASSIDTWFAASKTGMD